jgi:hypothetical protein
LSALRSFGSIIGAAVVLALLAGCGASGPQSPDVTPVISQGAASVQRAASFGAFNTLVARVDAKAVHPSVGRPWPALNQRGVHFFISDAADETVDVFGYKSLTQTGQITGLNEPQGMCDNKRMVWLADTGDSDLIHYNATGKMIGTLSDAGQYPSGCAVDRQDDLAVANTISSSGGSGSVSIWKHARGNPRNYPLPGGGRVYCLAYDPHGNLFVDGSNASGSFVLYELPKGGSTFVPITVVGATINFPGNLQYAYDALTIGDQSGSDGHSFLYQAHITGRKAVVDGTTEFDDAVDAVQVCITPFATAIVADAGSATVQIYAYPAGGNPIHTISGFGQPIGCAFTP